MNYKVLKNIPEHNELQNSITDELWPEFMFHDPVSNRNWKKLFEYFPEYQFSLQYDDEIIGVGNCLPFFWDNSFEGLPEEGWDWVLERGVADYEEGIEPNVLNGLQIAVSSGWQGKGVSTMILSEMAEIARLNGLNYVTIPVRPSLKSKYPLTSIDDYLKWKREDDLPVDPWLRVHARFGGRVIKPCHRAMWIPGRVEEWEKWTGLKFFESGEYVVEGALNPVEIDLEKNLGQYTEPNVWVLHEIK
ncbi:MAG TPA: GNAT family N-acetyltransferase [Thermotogota bacterium]|nr:GNAT family N-acetyltransferase [Thermotogota bacterium]